MIIVDMYIVVVAIKGIDGIEQEFIVPNTSIKDGRGFFYKFHCFPKQNFIDAQQLSYANPEIVAMMILRPIEKYEMTEYDRQYFAEIKPRMVKVSIESW